MKKSGVKMRVITTKVCRIKVKWDSGKALYIALRDINESIIVYVDRVLCIHKDHKKYLNCVDIYFRLMDPP